jgi:DNA polymerase III delta prime subunit
MTSLLITSSDKNTRELYIQSFCTEKGIDSLDLYILNENLEDKKVKKTLTSIGIQDIKRFQENLFFKPLRSKLKLSVIHDAHLLTTEAQNALLKVLEEPPAHTQIILTTENVHNLLGTILSRCQIKDLPTLEKEITEDDTHIFTTIDTLSTPKILELAETLSGDKEKALEWLKNGIYATHKVILRNNQDSLTTINLIKQLQDSYNVIKTTNVNARLVFEHLFFSLRIK